MRSFPSCASPMSADVPPTSSVITFACPASRPAQMPPTTPATGPDMSRLTGRFAAASAVATPDADVIRCRPVRTPSSVELLLQPVHVRPDLGADERVQADRREALVLAVLGQHLRRDGEERLGELLAHDLRHALLVRGVQEREEEAHRHGLDLRLLELAHLLARLLLVERHEHRAVLRDPLGHGQAMTASHDGVGLPRQVLVVREVERLLVPRDVEDVAVALRRDHPHRGAVVLDDDVRGDGRAVEHLVERGGALAGPLGELADAGHRALRRVVGRGRQLVHEHGPRLVVDVDEVGERAADVDADALHERTPGGEDDLPEELPALHEVHRLLRLLEGERGRHLRLQVAAGDEPEDTSRPRGGRRRTSRSPTAGAGRTGSRRTAPPRRNGRRRRRAARPWRASRGPAGTARRRRARRRRRRRGRP